MIAQTDGKREGCPKTYFAWVDLIPTEGIFVGPHFD